MPTRVNRFWWDPWEAFVNFHNFRDRHERKVGDIKTPWIQPIAHDWPDVGDKMLLLRWYCQLEEGEPVDREEINRARTTTRMITPTSSLWANRNNDWLGFDEEPTREGPQYGSDELPRGWQTTRPALLPSRCVALELPITERVSRFLKIKRNAILHLKSRTELSSKGSSKEMSYWDSTSSVQSRSPAKKKGR